jgi:hypothetical protein
MATTVDGSSNKLFICERPIYIGSVQKIYPKVQGSMNGGDRFFVVPDGRKNQTFPYTRAPAPKPSNRFCLTLVTSSLSLHLHSLASIARPGYQRVVITQPPLSVILSIVIQLMTL